jgi:long-chain acyl-CoA synthetase
MHFNHGVFGLLWRTATQRPGAPALAWGDRVVASYGELLQRALALAAGLAQLGCQSGDRVAIFMKNQPEWLPLLFGCWARGLAVVPVNVKLHARELAFILEDCQARVLFHDPDHAEALDALERVPSTRGMAAGSAACERLFGGGPATPVAVEPDALAWLFYTSGTTGRPKGAMLSHANLLAMAGAYANDVEPEGMGRAILHAAPMSHGSGLYILPHVLHGALHICPESCGFEVDELDHLLCVHQRVSMFAAPTMVSRLTASAATDLPGLQTLVYGGGPMYVADCLQAMDRFGERLAQIYGQGETPMTISALTRSQHDRRHPRLLERLASCGYAQTGVQIRILGPQGEWLPAGETGEIVLRAPTVMRGYWNLPQATASTLQDGWLHTGDVGFFDDDGLLTLKDRSKDVIISGGTNIYPREVEEVLLHHPAIREVCVLGVPDAEWGESVAAIYSCHAGQSAAPAELDQICIAHIARFKRPKHYLEAAELPKNAAGKILKTELRAQLAKKA